MSPPTPPFSALPLKKDGPRGNAWGLYGSSDLGMLNRLTPETTKAARNEIEHGIRIATDWPLNALKTPCFGRQAFDQHIKNKTPRAVNDDVLTLNTQSSTQWDGFRHFGYQDHKVFFNGTTQNEIDTSTKIGTHTWVENGGIVGRGILLDYEHWAETQNLSPNLLEATEITADQLNAIASSQCVTFKKGDILFIHTGFLSALSTHTSSAPDQSYVESSATGSMPAVGLKSCKETLEWIWEKEFAAVASDMMALEALPFQSTEFWLHEWMLGGWGMPIGELFDLGKLVKECRRLGKWSFFWSGVPLHVPGGVASPPNGVAIL